MLTDVLYRCLLFGDYEQTFEIIFQETYLFLSFNMVIFAELAIR